LVPFYPSENSVYVEGEMSTPTEIQGEVPQGSTLLLTLYIMHINETPQNVRRFYVALFADDTCLYSTDRKEGYVLGKLQRGLNHIETLCESCNIKINEDKPRAVYFS
jgi:hypothetical protein